MKISASGGRNGVGVGAPVRLFTLTVPAGQGYSNVVNVADLLAGAGMKGEASIYYVSGPGGDNVSLLLEPEDNFHGGDKTFWSFIQLGNNPVSWQAAVMTNRQGQFLLADYWRHGTRICAWLNGATYGADMVIRLAVV